MVSEKPQTGTQEHAISKIEVEKLFGEYTYCIPMQPSGSELSDSDVVILYGDNGCGKTTILKLLYNVLLPIHRPGSKSFVAKTKFKCFTICMNNGTTVTVERPGEKLVGSYKYLVKKDNEVIKETHLRTESDGAIRMTGGEEENEFRDLLRILSEINLGIWFLPDDRRFRSHIYSAEEEKREYSRELVWSHKIEAEDREEDELAMLLRTAMRRAFDWMKSQALSGSNIGSTNANTIYEEIINNIVQYPATENADSAKIKKVKQELMTLERRNAEFSKLGLTSELEVGTLISLVEKATPESQRIILNVLKPYTKGIKVRLDALEQIQQLISRLLQNINEMYADKSVQFDMNEGLRVISRTQMLLTPGMLSSGEKQLMLLLCDIITAREMPSVFIIDEPEISLNVKWQRRLIKVLLDCITGSSVQFVLATHSIELLTGYKEYVVKLVDRERSNEDGV